MGNALAALAERLGIMSDAGILESPFTSESRPTGAIADTQLAVIIDQYLAFYAAGTGHTARAKQLDTGKFLDFLKRHHRLADISTVTVRHWDFSSTQHFVDDSMKKGEAPATVARRLATLKHMGRMLAEKVPGFVNPARDVKPPKVQTLRPQSVSPHEVERVRERAAHRRDEKPSFNRMRNETLLTLLLDTGLRADEIRNIRMSQLDEKLQWIENVKTKGRRFRKVYITTTMRPRLQEYLALRSYELSRFFPKLSKSVDARLPLFISTYGANHSQTDSFYMSPKSVWRAIREFSVDTNLHPHLLRHTYAAELLESSRDIRLVAQALGHSDVRVTMRYTERTDQEVAAALEKTRRKG